MARFTIQSPAMNAILASLWKSPNHADMKANSLGWMLLLLVLVNGCSRQSDDAQANTKQGKAAPEERVAALARQNGCALLSDELDKTVGTNRVFAFNIQRVLDTNKRLAATASLKDLVQSGEQLEAVFEISVLDLGLWLSGACIAKLECPTNLVSVLISETYDDLCIAFDVGENQHALNFTTHPSGDDDHTVVSSVITIKGKLIAVTASGKPERTAAR